MSGRTDQYILNGDGDVVQEPDINRWGEWMQNSRMTRVVARTEVPGGFVSTVFLGLDHGFGQASSPVLWETMVFHGPCDQYQRRYSSREAAVRTRNAIASRLMDGETNSDALDEIGV